MPQLTNPRHEAFAQAYVCGATAGRRAAAYLAAGYKPARRDVTNCAARLLNVPHVKRRIAELRREWAAGVSSAPGAASAASIAGAASAHDSSFVARGDPMPALINPKHEAFCRALVSGDTAGNRPLSYQAAGYRSRGKSANQASYRLMTRPEVIRRIAELRQEMQMQEMRATERAVERLAITREAVLRELAKIAFANMLDYLRVDADGGIEVDLARIDRDKGAAIQDILIMPFRGAASGEQAAKTRERSPAGGAASPSGQMTPVRRIRLKLADKRAALVDLGRHFGLFAARGDAEDDYAELGEDELAAKIRDVVAQLGRLGIDVRSLFGIDEADLRGEPAARPN